MLINVDTIELLCKPSVWVCDKVW